MKDIKKLTNEELIQYINKAEQSTNQIFSGRFDRDKDIRLNPDLDQLFDIDSIRNQEKYQQIINLVIRMGYTTINYKTAISCLSEKDKDRLVIHMLLLEEARHRKLNIYDKEVRYQAYDHPKTISDIPQSLDFGNKPNILSSINKFDYPVRKACIVLFSKGYIPYWSSANEEDIKNRTGLIVKEKNVAYILIDPENLKPGLKKELLLNGNCNFQGAACLHTDDGKYYGISEEIISSEMSSDELSYLLFKKAIGLPDSDEKIRKHKKKKMLTR